MSCYWFEILRVYKLLRTPQSESTVSRTCTKKNRKEFTGWLIHTCRVSSSEFCPFWKSLLLVWFIIKVCATVATNFIVTVLEKIRIYESSVGVFALMNMLLILFKRHKITKGYYEQYIFTQKNTLWWKVHNPEHANVEEHNFNVPYAYWMNHTWQKWCKIYFKKRFFTIPEESAINHQIHYKHVDTTKVLT